MKHALPAVLGLLYLATPALADDALVPATQAVPELRAAYGKQIDVEIAPDFASGKLEHTSLDRVVALRQTGDTICLLGEGQGLEASSPALARYAAPDGSGAVCLPLSVVSVRPQGHEPAEGAAPVPLYSIDAERCTWVWRQGRDVGLWTESCKFDDRQWTVTYDAAKEVFAQQVNGEEHAIVLRPFHAPGGPPALLATLKQQGLIFDKGECQMMQVDTQPAPDGWTAWQVLPTGKLKEEFDKEVQIQVPEPPCGKLGFDADSIGFFMVSKDHPDRVLYVYLGQDGTMIDLTSIRIK